MSGRGHVDHLAGTNAVGATLNLGELITGVGSYNLANAAVLSVGLNEQIGIAGRGTFTQAGGTHTVNADLYIGASATGNGTATLSAGNWSVAGTAFLAYRGKATFNQTGGAFSAAQINLGDGAAPGSAAVGTVNLSGGSFAVGAAGLTLGYQQGATGIWSMSNGATLAVGGDEYIGRSGNGAFTQTGGAHTAAASVYLGASPGASGTATLSGGAWRVAGFEAIGYSGKGTFVQSGGTHTVGADLYLAFNPGSTGVVSLSGGNFTVANTAFIAYQGNAAVTQSAGNFAAAQVNLADRPGAAATFTQTGNAAVNVGAAGLNIAYNPGATGAWSMSSTASSISTTW